MALALAAGVSLIDAPYARDQYLQHIPTAIGVPILAWTAWRGRVSSLSMTCIVLFTLLHVLGARYVYSVVPYDRVLESLFGFTLADTFGFERNHYDRLVHLMFGLLLTVPVVELLRRRGAEVGSAALLAFAISMGASAIYEIFEWLLTLAMASEDAHRYNGQQGDLWDTQKDMALAGIGAAIAVIAVARRFGREPNAA